VVPGVRVAQQAQAARRSLDLSRIGSRVAGSPLHAGSWGAGRPAAGSWAGAPLHPRGGVMAEVVRRSLILIVLVIVALALDLLAFLAAALWVWMTS
jgi:hypothetical protein